MRMRAPVAAVVALMAVLAGAAGCSEEVPPGETVPELATQLDKVDAAVEEGDLEGARQATRRLVARTAVARAEGDITGEEADRIIEAAEALLAELPEPPEEDEDSG